MVEHEMEDIILSQLPPNLIECILDRLPFKDVVRTSVLARSWRYVWATFQKLELDWGFCKCIANKQFPLMVYKILSLHFGPIQKFILHIPKCKNIDISEHLDCWMHMLSKKGIEDLELGNSYRNQPYKLPHCIFVCPSLKVLKLKNCLLEPPQGFGGLTNLTSLWLCRVSLASVDTFQNLLPSAPRLSSLYLIDCIGTVKLRVQAPRLCYLFVHCGPKFRFELGGNFPSLTGAWVRTHITSEEFDSPEGQKNMEMFQCLFNITTIKTLHLYGSTLGLKRLLPKTGLGCLTELGLLCLQFNDLSQICAALGLIRSSPNLRNLEIMSSPIEAEGGKEEVIKYLEDEEKQDVYLQQLHQLQTVKLSVRKVSGVEVFFTKFLLAKLFALRTLTIQLSHKIDALQTSTIFPAILAFPRASVAASIICLQPDEDYPILVDLYETKGN